MKTNKLIDELLTSHTVKIFHGEVDGKVYASVDIDGIRAGDYVHVPQLDCDACRRRRKAAARSPKKLETRASA